MGLSKKGGGGGKGAGGARRDEVMCPKERAAVSVWSCQRKLAGEGKERFLFPKKDVKSGQFNRWADRVWELKRVKREDALQLKEKTY